MTKPKLKRTSVAMRCKDGVEGWFYENAKSIDVYIRDKEVGKSLNARIQRALLADWIERTKEKP